MLDSKLELDNKDHMCDVLELTKVLERDITQLSGGELQRFAIAMSCVQRADVCVAHVFDSQTQTDFYVIPQIHVRRTVKLPGCQAAVTRGGGYPLAPYTRLLRRRCRARFVRSRLPFGLHLLSIRQAIDVRRRNHALLRARRYTLIIIP
jgi:hypothetical protein